MHQPITDFIKETIGETDFVRHQDLEKSKLVNAIFFSHSSWLDWWSEHRDNVIKASKELRTCN
jgi:hypothetical protein